MTEVIKVPYAFRMSCETDEGYILKTWNKSWRKEKTNKHMSNAVYYRQANAIFKQILDKFGAVVVCNPEDPDQIYGFAVAAYLPSQEWCLFWIHIKQLYSNLGIGTNLYNFVRDGRPNGPICPFVRANVRRHTEKYGIVEAPMIITDILNIKDIKGVEI